MDDSQEEEESVDQEAKNAFAEVLKVLFGSADFDGNGFISLEEFDRAIRSYGIELSEKQVETFFNQSDTNKDGQIDSKEFATLMTKSVIRTLDFTLSEEQIETKIRENFPIYDTDNDGCIGHDELPFLLQKIAHPSSMNSMSQKIIRWTASVVDPHHTGYILLDSLLKHIREDDEVLRLMQKISSPTPGAYLKQFIYLPSSCRKSVLHRAILEGRNRASSYLKPLLADGGLHFQDIVLDPTTNALVPVFVNTFKFSLDQAKGIPSILRSKKAEVLERKVFMCLFDNSDESFANKILSNILVMEAYCDPKREDEWKFKKKNPENSFILRTHTKYVTTTLLLEFVLVVKNSKKAKPVHVSVGWTTLNLMKEEYKSKKTISLSISGGTPFTPVQIDKKFIPNKEDLGGKVLQFVQGIPDPMVSIKIQKVSKTQKLTKYQALPTNILLFTQTTPLIKLMRSYLAKKLYGSSDLDNHNLIQCDATLAWLSNLLDTRDGWNVFWKDYLKRVEKLSKKETQNATILLELFQEMVASIWIAKTCLSKPAKQHGIESPLKDRNLFYEKFAEKPLGTILQTEDYLYKPFSVNELQYDQFT